MASARWVTLALLLTLLLPSTRGLQYQHDELLWTKQNWQDYTLHFPWSAALKQRDAESTRQLQGPLEGFSSNSLNGPLLDAEEIARRVAEDASRGPVLQQSSLDVSLLDEEANLDAAAGVAQCKVCGVLVQLLWEGLTRWVTRHHQVPNRKHIAAYAEELCEIEVTNELLKGWVLLRARVQQGEGLPFALEGQTQEFYMLSQRAKQHATPSEIQAVRKACLKLLKEDEAGKEKPQVLHQASTLVHKYYQLMVQATNRWADAKQRPEAVEAVDDGPRAQRKCFDRHPQCVLWREKGECEGNPKYMLGDEGANNGWCRAACGHCPEEEEDQEMRPVDVEYIRGAQADLLAVFQAKACVSAAPCKWAAGEGMQQLLASARAGADRGAAELMESAEFIGGPVMSRQQQLEASIDQTRLKESKPMLVRELNDAVVPDRGRPRRSTQPPEHFLTESGTVLWQELGAKCVYVSTGWWMYEICYMHHITQFHMTDKHDIDWTISLGAYEPGSANWTLTNTSLSGLYPHFTKVPYASQTYNSGNHCDLDPDESGKQRSVLRSSELRLMCSPDADMHIIVVEPQQCSYVVELYVPELCALPGFQVVLPDTLGSHIGFATKPRTSAKGARGVASAVAGGDGEVEEEEGEEGLDPVYALPETDEDEYADPDDEEEGQQQANATAHDEL